MWASPLLAAFLAAAGRENRTSPCERPGPGIVAPRVPSDRVVENGDMWAPGYEDRDLGIGTVRLDEGDDESWWTRVVIPLYRRPGDEPWGWFVSGWLADLRAKSPVPVGTTGMVETGYETMSFMVVEAGEDGWLRIRYGKPTEGRDGTGWTHTCHLEEQRLRYQPYEDLFSGRSDLFFRNERNGLRHALRAGPNETETLLHWIPSAHDLEAMEIRGDWMRVRVSEPPGCIASADDVKPAVREGWVRWRSADKGPWVWYRTRGC